MTRRLVGGIIVGLPKEWRAAENGLHLETDPDGPFSVPAPLTAATTAAISNGTLDTLRDTSAFSPGFFHPIFTANRK